MTADDEQSPDEAAVQWFVILNDEDVTDEQRRTFERWLAAHPSHAKAWMEVEKSWRALDAWALSGDQSDTQPLGRDATDDAAPITPPYQPRRSPREWGRTQVMATAAALVLAVGIGWQALPVGLWSDYRTAIGERRVVALDDGSEIELGSASALDVEYGPHHRKVKLITGEAFFTVAKDAARPFVVSAQNGEILVLGTAFNVKISNDVAVAVTHNTVEVKAPTRPAVRVTHGQGVHYDQNNVSAVTAVDLDTIQAWRQDQLIFHDARLVDVLKELQRYRRGYIQLLESDLADRRVTAVFDVRRPEAALDTIARNLDLRLYRATDLLIGITSN